MCLLLLGRKQRGGAAYRKWYSTRTIVRYEYSTRTVLRTLNLE